MNLGAPGWLVSWLQAWSVWDLVLLAAAVVGVVVFLRKKGWRWVVAFAQAILATADVIDHVKELPAFIQRTDDRLDEHTRQLKNSHDSNLRDDVTSALQAAERTEASVQGLHGRLDEVERNVASLAKADVEIRDALEHHLPTEESP